MAEWQIIVMPESGTSLANAIDSAGIFLHFILVVASFCKNTEDTSRGGGSEDKEAIKHVDSAPFLSWHDVNLVKRGQECETRIEVSEDFLIWDTHAHFYF